MKTKLLLTILLLHSFIVIAQVIYSEEFDEGINKFSSSSSLTTSINNNNLLIVGNGTSGPWDNNKYTFHNSGTNTNIDLTTNPKLFIKVKAENSPQLRIDLYDTNGYLTNLNPISIYPTSEFQIFELNFTGRFQDGGYGGSCTSGPCTVNSAQLTDLGILLNPGTGAYSGTVTIEWISFGESLEAVPDLNLKNAKVIGYLPDYRFSLSNQIDYSKLTHLNICFANPDASGNIVMSDFSSIVNDAKSQNPDIKILLSLAGGGIENTPIAVYWSNLIDIPANRPAFISKIVNFINTNNLDGVDIDLEFDLVTSGYSDFVIELNTALDVQGKLLTVAFPKVYYEHLTQEALETFDFINLMAYDNAGFWNPTPAQHSSLSFAEESINFWTGLGKISGEKLILGVPFYGHNFDLTQFVSYGEMVASNVDYADTDKVGNTFYNGRPTIGDKVELAYRKAGGIMIWELGQDAFNEYSLLSTIHQKYTDLNVTTTGLGINSSTLSIFDNQDSVNSISIYPNPSSGNILKFTNAELINSIRIFDSNGQELKSIKTSGDNYIDVGNFSSGIYLITLQTSTGVIPKKFIKM
jgi:hypothetical protein